MVHDGVEDRLIDAARIFLNLGAADSHGLGVGEQLLGKLAN